MSNKLKKITSFVVFLQLIFVLLLLPARAVEYGGVGGRPANPRTDNPRTESIFVQTLNPGEKVTDAVKVINNTDKEKTILVYAVDSVKSSGGAFACEQFVDTKDDAGAWIKLSKTEVTLKSGTSENVSFDIAAPTNASVGEHNACIALQDKGQNSEASSGSGVVLTTRSAIRVLLQIPGDVKKELSITDFSVKQKDLTGYTINAQVKNTGNVSLDSDVKVLVRDVLGNTVQTFGGTYSILRDDTTDLNFEFPNTFIGGLYTFALEVTYDKNPENSVGSTENVQKETLTRSLSLQIVNPQPIGLAIDVAILLVVTGVVIVGVRKWMFAKAVKDTWVDYKVKSGDEIEKLAEKYRISWKKLAEVNKIKAPFKLNAGEKILVPPTK